MVGIHIIGNIDYPINGSEKSTRPTNLSTRKKPCIHRVYWIRRKWQEIQAFPDSKRLLFPLNAAIDKKERLKYNSLKIEGRIETSGGTVFSGCIPE